MHRSRVGWTAALFAACACAEITNWRPWLEYEASKCCLSLDQCSHASEVPLSLSRTVASQASKALLGFLRSSPVHSRVASKRIGRLSAREHPPGRPSSPDLNIQSLQVRVAQHIAHTRPRWRPYSAATARWPRHEGHSQLRHHASHLCNGSETTPRLSQTLFPNILTVLPYSTSNRIRVSTAVSASASATTFR